MVKVVAPLSMAALIVGALGLTGVGAAWAVSGSCPWVDGNRPDGTSIMVGGWTFTCQSGVGNVLGWFPGVVAPSPRAEAPDVVAAQPAAPRYNRRPPEVDFPGYCVGDQFVETSRVIYSNGNGGYYWTDAAPIEFSTADSPVAAEGMRTAAAHLVAAECHDSVLS